MKLIICEKPSVSQTISHSVGALEKVYDGKEYYYKGDEYIVAHSRGHIYGIGMPEDYNFSKIYNLDELPMFPDFRIIEAGEDTKELRVLLKKLMLSADVDEIICATDAGREGELIFRHIYKASHCHKPVKRLWCNSMTDEAVRKCLADLPDDKEFDGLYRAALAREYSDWLIGMNLSRLYSIKDDYPHRVGRVKTPVLSIIAERDRETERFVSKKTYRIELDNGAVSENVFAAENEAAAVLSDINGNTAVVSDIKITDKKKNRPRLFSLSGLQQEANDVCDFTAKHTLETAQALYEKKLITYPRTDCEYLSEDMRGNFINTVRSFEKSDNYSGRVKNLIAQGIDPDDRVINTENMAGHDHHAIIPESFRENVSLNDDEHKLYNLIINRTLCSVDREYFYTEKIYSIECGGMKFSLKANIPTEIGWKKYDIYHTEKISHENYERGYKFSVNNARVRECTQQPPKHYTDATLISVMNNIDNRIPDSELKAAVKGKGIGTEATRAEIIEQLISAGYIERKGKSLCATRFGREFIDSLPLNVRSAERTAEWEQRLEEIRNGADPDEFISDVKKFVVSVIDYENSPTRNRKPVRGERQGFGGRKIVGECPRCGKNICEGRKCYYCESGRDGCGYVLWKEPKFIKGSISPENAEKLIRGEHIRLTMFTKNGEEYSAECMLEDTGKYVNIKRVPKEKNIVGNCPGCGKPVYESEKNFYCSGGRNECGFVLWKENFHGKVMLTAEDAAVLLNGKSVSRSGRSCITDNTGRLTELKEVRNE